jgi:hypothetical protein
LLRYDVVQGEDIGADVVMISGSTFVAASKNLTVTLGFDSGAVVVVGILLLEI